MTILHRCSALRLLVLVVVILTTSLGSAPSANAHGQDEIRVVFERSTSALSGRVIIPQAFADDALDAASDDPAAITAFGDRVTSNLHVATKGSAASALALSHRDAVLTPTTGLIEIEFTGPATTDDLDVWFNFEGNGFAVSTVWIEHVVDSETVAVAGLTKSTQVETLTRTGKSGVDRVLNNVWNGVNHVREGSDHTIFVSLLALATLVLNETTSTFRRFAEMAAQLTLFTVAHSVLYVLVLKGLIPAPPARIIEPAIVATLLWLAVRLVRAAEGSNRRSLSLEVVAFGLLHGAGFAGASAALRGAPTTDILARLAGIELAHIVVVGLVGIPAIYLASHRAFERGVQLAGTTFVVLTGLWFVERALALNLGAESVATTLTTAPVGIWVVVAMTLAAFSASELPKRMLA